MNKALWVILFILLILVGRKRGLKTFLSFFLSIILIVIYIILMGLGFNAIILAFIICILASLISIFLLNGYSAKTKSALIGVILVQIITFILIYIVTKRANIGGFGTESLETIGGFDLGINYNMSNVIVGMYLVSIVGTVIDTAMSIATAMNEVHENNPKLKEKELYKSGMNVGRDILSTTINTLYFALVSTFIGFFMWHRGYIFEEIINYKMFAKDIIQLLIAFISSILIIPLTAYISSQMLTYNRIKILDKFKFIKLKKQIKKQS